MSETDRVMQCTTCDRDLSDVQTDECPGCGSDVRFNHVWVEAHDRGLLDVIATSFRTSTGAW